MSDKIPSHIQEEIMKRLLVKSLVQFSSVSKAWKSLIDSADFITAHSHRRHTQPQHLLVSYEDAEGGAKYVSYIDNDTFPQHRSISTLPVSDEESFYLLCGSSHGLFCLLNHSNNSEPGMAVIWNPSIRKSIVVPVPVPGKPSVGFGVCPLTGDPKIVAVTQSRDKLNIETSYQCEVMVYTLSSGKWRSLSASLPTNTRIQDFWCTMDTDRFIYWRAGSQTLDDMIVSFDVTTENFEVIDLPDFFANRRVYFSNIRESLVIVEYSENIGTVWMMEHGVEKAFTKLFTIKTPHDFVVGFRKSGIPIVKVTDGDPDDFDYDDQPSNLVVCEPNSEHNNVIEICPDNFTVDSYTETLLLLDRSNCNSH